MGNLSEKIKSIGLDLEKKMYEIKSKRPDLNGKIYAQYKKYLAAYEELEKVCVYIDELERDILPAYLLPGCKRGSCCTKVND